MFVSDARSHLRDLHLRTNLETVKSVVQRLRNGESIYQISEGEFSQVAKKTANKIKTLLEEGKLGFLWETQPEIEAIDEAIAEAIPMAERANAHPNLLEQDIPAKRLQTFWNNVDPFEASSIEDLERLGIPTKKSIDILSTWDIVLAKLNTEHGTVADLKLAIFTHHYVRLFRLNSERKYKAPEEIIFQTAEAYSKGWVDENVFLIKMAEDVFAYQIWRGSDFLAAFKRRQVWNRRIEKYYLQLFEHLLNFDDAEEATHG